MGARFGKGSLLLSISRGSRWVPSFGNRKTPEDFQATQQNVNRIFVVCIGIVFGIVISLSDDFDFLDCCVAGSCESCTRRPHPDKASDCKIVCTQVAAPDCIS